MPIPSELSGGRSSLPEDFVRSVKQNEVAILPSDQRATVCVTRLSRTGNRFGYRYETVGVVPLHFEHPVSVLCDTLDAAQPKTEKPDGHPTVTFSLEDRVTLTLQHDEKDYSDNELFGYLNGADRNLALRFLSTERDGFPSQQQLQELARDVIAVNLVFDVAQDGGKTGKP